MRKLMVKPEDKRTGKKSIGERKPIEIKGLPQIEFEEALSIFVQVKKANNLKGRTIDGYIQNMRYFTEWLTENYGDLTVADITIQILREYVLWCAEEKEFYGGHPYKSEFAEGKRGLSPASVNVRIRVLKAFFTVMYGEEYIERNPATNLALMRQDIDTVEPLSDDELRRFLKAPDQKSFSQFRDYVIMILIIDSGMRLGEIISLEKSEVDLMKKQITLPASKNKNRKSRILPLSVETVRLLKQLITETSVEFDTEYVFTTNYGEKMSEKTLQKAFTKYAEKAKIGKTVSPHKLRHNFATIAAMNGMSVFTLMKLMGHGDIATTRKYVQVSGDDIANQHRDFTPLSKILKKR